MTKRCALLMRHELIAGQCRLEVVYDHTKSVSMRGDINNLVQVLTNLLANAVYAQKQAGGGVITVSYTHRADAVLEIFRAVLEKDSLGVNSDYFLSGGNSLNAMETVSRMEERFG